jgi:hypothetical protein
MNEDMQNELPESENELIAPFEGKLDISHVVSVIMDHIGGIVRIPAEKFTSSMTVDRKLIIEYDNESRDFIITIEQGLVGKEEIEVE